MRGTIPVPTALTTIHALADTIVGWQGPGGGIDPNTCVFHHTTPLLKPSAYGQDTPWLVRALYAAYDATGETRYRSAADRYSVHFLATMYANAPTFAMGDAIDPCFSGYRTHNPYEDSIDDKAHTLRDWILGRSTDLGHAFNVHYPWRDDQKETRHGSDAAFSNDLADVGRALVYHASFFKDAESLAAAERLAKFFTTSYTEGSLDGVWSDDLGTWLIGPHPARGFENVDEYSNKAGWGWTAYYALHFLVRLHDVTEDSALQERIREIVPRSIAWTFDACQFEDGALGMAERDDKWLGMTGLAILGYVEVQSKGWLAGDFESAYGPKALAALRWLQSAAAPDQYPKDGFIAVTAKTRPDPGWNSSWMLGIVLEALLAGRAIELTVPDADSAR